MIAMTEADGFALAMIAMLALSLGTVLVILIAIVRAGSRQDREVEDLIDEISREEKSDAAPAGKGDAAPLEAWEKEADWWKN
ncbi:hypothetical protein [Haloferula sargassicola]|uniref:Uncharacterized protein n=1 Tax=Haloferula sargassicola TaxID=490096 RepID=A0ABP9UTK8_9BACT